MKVTVELNHPFEVRAINFSPNGDVKISLSFDGQEDKIYEYEVDLGNRTASEKPERDLVEYAQEYMKKSNVTEKTKSSYVLILKHLEKYGSRDLSDITTNYLQGFISYLEHTGMRRGTVRLYFQKLTCVLHNAYKEELFDDRILARVKRPKKEQGRKSFLTERELKRMMKTPTAEKYAEIREMFLFSCFSGLRYSDVCKLKWSEVKHHNKHLFLEFRQQKTRSSETLPLCPQAEHLLKRKGHRGERVFHPMSEPTVNKVIKDWCKAAHIKKDISFHTARHTFCVMLLTHDVPIFTVQQLMGHSDIETTKVYADIMSSTKRKAVNRLPLFGMSESAA